MSTKVLVVDDDPQMQLAMRASLQRAGYTVTTASCGQDAVLQLEAETFECMITDQRMPEMSGIVLLSIANERYSSMPVVMVTAHGTITQAVEAMQAGAADFITKPFSADDLIRVVERVLSVETKALRTEGKSAKGRAIVTNDATMIRMLEIAQAVARSDATVLLQGESGTGKELVARLIHTSSPRSSQPFVAVNCAALPDTLLESELFGHEKGAFTGAQQRKIGKFELAHGGTILLDEISEMELTLQAKLLRVLQEREVDRIGGKDPISIDVRVVATTNRNLLEMVEQGKFRADLYYRLNVIPLTLPSLRERRGDVKLLIEHFMSRYLGVSAPRLPEDIISRLEQYSWPGNVRELQNAVERAAILSKGGELRESDFLLSAGHLSATSIPLAQRIEKVVDVTTPVIKSGTTVHEMERALIFETLRSTQYNRTQAAKLLGISIRTLRNKLHEYRQEGSLPVELIEDREVEI